MIFQLKPSQLVPWATLFFPPSVNQCKWKPNNFIWPTQVLCLRLFSSVTVLRSNWIDMWDLVCILARPESEFWPTVWPKCQNEQNGRASWAGIWMSHVTGELQLAMWTNSGRNKFQMEPNPKTQEPIAALKFISSSLQSQHNQINCAAVWVSICVSHRTQGVGRCSLWWL